MKHTRLNSDYLLPFDNLMEEFQPDQNEVDCLILEQLAYEANNGIEEEEIDDDLNDDPDEYYAEDVVDEL